MGSATTATAAATTARTPPFLRNEAPPIVHALGGSIGSALALLLFYPLERARIELQSKAAVSSSSSARLRNEETKEKVAVAISPIRNADNTQLLIANDNDDEDEDDDNIVEEASWDRAADSPSSWSMNSCSIDDDNTVSSTDDSDDSSNNDDSTDSILRCLLDLRERGVLYQGVKPIISTIFTRYV